MYEKILPMLFRPLMKIFPFSQVIDSKGHILYQKEDATKGKFAFTTEEYDMFEVCFESQGRAGGKVKWT